MAGLLSAVRGQWQEEQNDYQMLVISAESSAIVTARNKSC